MHTESSPEDTEDPPAAAKTDPLKEFHSAGRGFWRDVPEKDWNDWHWQLKHRITSAEQLQRLMPG